MTVEIKRHGAPLSAPPRCKDLCATAILCGEKGDDLPKDAVREIADAVRWRFYWFLRSTGALLAAQPGPRSTSGSGAGRSLICVHTNLKEKNGITCRIFEINSQGLEEKRVTNIYVGHFKINSQDLATNY